MPGPNYEGNEATNAFYSDLRYKRLLRAAGRNEIVYYTDLPEPLAELTDADATVRSKLHFVGKDKDDVGYAFVTELDVVTSIKCSEWLSVRPALRDSYGNAIVQDDYLQYLAGFMKHCKSHLEERATLQLPTVNGQYAEMIDDIRGLQVLNDPNNAIAN